MSVTAPSFDGFRHRDLARLARVVQALRRDDIIELSAMPIQRGVIIERFRCAPDRVDGVRSFLHNSTITRGRAVTTSHYEPLDWSVQALIEMTAWWPSVTLDNLEPTRPGDSDAAQVYLRGLDETGRRVLNGTMLVLETRPATADEPWTITISPERNDGQWGADDLVTLP